MEPRCSSIDNPQAIQTRNKPTRLGQRLTNDLLSPSDNQLGKICHTSLLIETMELTLVRVPGERSRSAAKRAD